MFYYYTGETFKKSKRVLRILQSGASVDPTEADKRALRAALDDCSELVSNSELLFVVSVSNGLPHSWGLRWLCEALKTNKTIKLLDLGHLKILNQDEHIACLASALESNTTLTSLRLTNCDLDSKALLTLTNALARNNTVTQLDLSYNQFTPQAAAYLIQETKLIQLDLSMNFEDLHSNLAAPYEGLLNVLKENTTLKHLELTPLIELTNPETISQLANTLMYNKTLIQLVFIPGNGQDAQLVSTLKNAIDSTLEGPVRSPTLIKFIYDPHNRNTLFQAALLDQRNRIQERAYTAGHALSSHLNKDAASVVADYLGFKGAYFTAGINRQPKPAPTWVAPPTLSKLAVFLGIGLGVGLGGMGVFVGLISFIIALVLVTVTPNVVLGLLAGVSGLALLGLSHRLWKFYQKKSSHFERQLNEQVKKIIEEDNRSSAKPASIAPQVAAMPVPTSAPLGSGVLEQPPVNELVKPGSQKPS